MGRTFSTRHGTTRVVFGRGSVERLDALCDELLSPKPKKLLVISTPGRAKDAARLKHEVLAMAKEHVPEAIVKEACEAVARAGADMLVAYGGGSAIGLAKAVAVTFEGGATTTAASPLRIIAVPTTYSGSEMTPIFGVTRDREKRTGRDERARAELVIYDAKLLEGLPPKVAMTSLWNALAHAIEALWIPGVDRAIALVAEEAARLITSAARRLPQPIAIDEALEGAYLAGSAFADAGSGLHHKLCHVLGGAFDLPHAETHAALLRHITRWMSKSAPDAMAALGRAMDASDPVRALDELAIATGVSPNLASVGFDVTAANASRVIDAVLASPPPSLRALDRDGLALLLDAAATSKEPKTTMPMQSLRAPETIAHQPGYGSTHESEALPGALPRKQNAPRPAPYGLYPELLSGTPFTAKNALNSRVWMYRVRPSFSHDAYRLLTMPRFTNELEPRAEPNRTRWSPLPVPQSADRTDFVDGLVTLGGDGSSLGPGYLVNLYAANADMIDRSFATADGDVLIIPQSGTLDIRTELGFLRASPGSIVVIPRAIKFAVGLPDKQARGWMLEVFGPRLRLPERGLIGSNGLADARHFLAPVASYEDRTCPNGFETLHKLAGHLYTAKQSHSPFDVVAWHGVHSPFVYDLMNFNAMGSTTFDHVDPSIHTVLTAPLDDHGRAIVDFVAFRGRWDVAEHSFRPPFMHRNAATEINGVVSVDTLESGYAPGCTFISPLLTSHGITTSAYDANFDMPDAQHEGPHRMPDESLWIMFESAMPFRLSKWARETPLIDKSFLPLFEGLRSRFDASRP